MPIPLGILAVAGAGGGGIPLVQDFELIQTVNVSSTQFSVTFSSIPSTYRHLQLRLVLKDGSTFTDGAAYLRLNGDASGQNYAIHQLLGNGSNVISSGNPNMNELFINQTTTNRAGQGGNFSTHIVDILDYANTSKFKTTRTLTGVNNGSLSSVRLISGLWRNTAAVNSITVFHSDNGPTTGSRLSLYGIKG